MLSILRTSAASVCVLALVAACGRKTAPIPKEPAPAPTSADSIPLSPLGGSIAGQPFLVKTGRYFIDRRPRYEKLEIVLSAAESKDPCADLSPQHASNVWLRRKGPGKPTVQTARISHKGPAAAWEAHYERYNDGKWSGNGDAAALISISSIGADRRLQGELHACFADVSGSCVKGRFKAVYCPIRMDSLVRGTQGMELPPDGGGSWTKAVDAGAADGSDAVDADDAVQNPPPGKNSPPSAQPKK